MRWRIFIVILSLVLNANAQVKFNRQHHQFGTLTAGSDRYADFIITNKSSKKIFVLRIENDREVAALITNKTLLPDSSAIIRLQYNPQNSGRFNKQIGVYVSSQNDPIVLSLSGEILEMPASKDLACPDFNSKSSEALTPEFVLDVQLIDKLTGEGVKGAELKLVMMGMPRYVFTSDKDGVVMKKIPLGYYYFVAKADNYYSNEFDAYVNVRNNKLLIEMMPKDVRPIDPSPLDSLFYLEHPIPPIKDPGREDEWIGRDSLKPKEEMALVLNNEPKKDSVVVASTEFDNTNYLKNNIVFLIDISGSMMTDGKMELLKASMIELTKMLRPVDQISIVVYASNARIVLQPISGDQKERVISTIQQMEGGGYTAGAEGMKMAYDLANRNKIEGGNNMVIMATDGAFNLYTTDVMPMVKRYNKRGIHTSVVGIKNTERDASSMKSIASQGDGRYVPILNFEEALNSLTEEIKTASRIR